MKIKPADQVEVELMAAMESFSDEHLGIAEEAWPENIKEAANRSFKHYPHKNPATGYADYDRPEPDKGAVSSHLKNLGDFLASYGISVKNTDFDSYELKGVSIERFPKDSLTILRYGKDLYLYSPQGGGINRSRGAGHYLTRRRDGKKVSYERIPTYQLISEANNIWIIPLEETEPINKLRQKRSTLKGESGRNEK